MRTQTALVLLTAVGVGTIGLAARQGPPPGGNVEVQIMTRPAAGGATAALPMLPVPQTGTGLIVGQVIDAGTERPVPGAIVAIGGALPTPQAGEARMVVMGGPAGDTGAGASGPPSVPRVMTDSEGRFFFRNVPKGGFTLTAVKPGYLEGAYGRFRPDGGTQPLDLEDGARVDDVTIRVFRPAVITGLVTDERGEPVVGAQVRAHRRGLVAGRRVLSTTGPTATTDDRGVYRIANLTPGEYIVAVPTSTSSAPANLGFAGGLPPDLMATMITPANPGFSYTTGGTPMGTDGRFVLQDMARSSIGATLGPDGRLLSYPTTYYPSVSVVSQALPVAVRSGEERAGVDLLVNLTPTATIAGQLIGPDGPAENYALHLVPSDTGMPSSDPAVATAVTDSDGSFMFLGVPAGQYVIQTIRVPRALPRPAAGTTVVERGAGGGTMVFSTATATIGPGGPPPPQAPNEPTLWAAAPVSVGGTDVRGVNLTLQEGIKVAGRVEFEGSSERPPAERLQRLSITLEPADGRPLAMPAPGRVEAEGQFATSGSLPGRYVVRVANLPPGWVLKSVTFGGLDLAEAPFELDGRGVTGAIVTLTDRISSLSGTVRTAQGMADDTAAVIVFPSDNRSWADYGTNPRRMRLVRATKTGAYSFPALPAGDYHVVAISEEFAGEWQDPRFLDQLAREAERVTVGEGDGRKLDLTTRAVRRGGEPSPAPASAAAVDDAWDPLAGHGPFVPDAEDAAPQVRDARIDTGVGTGVVSGVVTLEDGQPVRNARVQIRQADVRTDRTVMTDDEGRFAITGLPSGRYSLTASKPAYVSGYYGARPGRGPGTPIALGAGQTMSGLTIRMARGGVIAGQVVDEFGQPYPGATVRAMQPRTVGGERAFSFAVAGAPLGNTVTDDRGQYRLYGLTPGQYVVVVTANPAAGGAELRQLSTADVQSAVADLQRSTPPAAPPAVGTGVMTGAGGRGAGGTSAAAPVPFGGRAVGLAPVYYPGTATPAEAVALTVAAGAELANIDLAVRFLPTARIEGRLVGPDGRPVTGASVLLLPEGGSPAVLRIGSVSIRTRPDGTFEATNVTPGRYTITARSGGGGSVEQVIDMGGGGVFVTRARETAPAATPTRPAEPQKPLWAEATVDVAGEDLAGLQLTMQEGMTIRGRLTFDGRRAPPADLSQVRMSVVPAGATRISVGAPSVMVDASGRFTVEGVTPGSYRINAIVPPAGFTPDSGWMIKSAMLDGRDTLDTQLTVAPGQNVDGLVVTFTDLTTELSGTLLDPAGQAVPDLTILVFSTERAFWQAGSRRMPQPLRPASDGTFRVALPAGEYYLAAVTEIDPDDWGDPAYMEQVAALALKIAIAEGEKKVQDLRIAGGR